ncbi:MAG: type II and III secretion system protein [Bacteroidota bacterium]|nr:type II and III secretion system protein [Bacteroidota bacterium]
MKHKYFLLVCLCLIFIQVGFGQTRDVRLKTKGYINPQEIVSLDSTMRMDQALLVINELSKQYAGKIIIDLEKRRDPIGAYVVNQHWRDALEIILNRHGLTYVEEADYIRIMQIGAAISTEGRPLGLAPGEPPPTLDSRDVKISAVFFSTDVNKMQNYGISWNFFRSKKKEPTMSGYMAAAIVRGDTVNPVPPVGSGGGQVQPSFDRAIGVLQSPPEFTFANIDALVKFFGETGIGELLTNPDVVVRDGKKGRIQVGSDFFITTRDIAGNAINQSIPTGTIVEVTPIIYSQADTDYIYLDINIEKSDYNLSAAGPIIDRQSVKTHVLLYDGEETVIGGLVSNKMIELRQGIPILKDLPWWVFGLRYIFGSEEKQRMKSELIVLLKVELSPRIRDRVGNAIDRQKLINDKRKEYQKEFEKK